MRRSLDEQTPEFDERNLFLFLTLGLLSLGDRLEDLLRSHAPQRPEHGRGVAADELEPLAYLLLGAIRVRDVIRRELLAGACETAALRTGAAPSEFTAVDSGDLLR